MAQIHEDLKAEGVTKEALATMIKGKRGSIGRLYLTPNRLVFLQLSPLFMAFGALGGLLMAVVKPKKIGVEIPLDSITGIERVKHGINKNVLSVSHGSGEEARFAVKYDEWEPLLRQAQRS